MSRSNKLRCCTSQWKHILAPCGRGCHQATYQQGVRNTGINAKMFTRISLWKLIFCVNFLPQPPSAFRKENNTRKLVRRISIPATVGLFHQLFGARVYIFTRILCHNMSWHIIHFFPIFPFIAEPLKINPELRFLLTFREETVRQAHGCHMLFLSSVHIREMSGKNTLATLI